MPVPRQMTEHTLEALKGWPRPHAVDFSAVFNAAELVALPDGVAYAGRVVHLNAAGEFQMGIGNGDMALFLLQNSDDPDVENPGGAPLTVAGAWIPVAPTGKLSALVATGAYELSSTEFDDTQVYVLNEALTAVTGAAAAGGQLTNVAAVPYTNPVCGVVSRGRYVNSHGKPELAFWPVFLPV